MKSSKRPEKAENLVTRIRKKPGILLIALAIVATTVLLLVFRREIWGVFSSPERIEETVTEWGLWAPLAFIILQIVQVVIFIIPGEIPQIAGGYLFGLVPGSLYSILGIVAGSSFNFLLARVFGVPFVRVLFKENRLRDFEAITHSSRAQIAFFLLFVIPGIPKDILCYVAGLSPLRFVAFLVISTIGRIPGIVGSAAMGSAAASKEWLLAVILLVLAVVLFVLGMIYRERIHTVIERFALKPSADGRSARFPAQSGEDQTKGI